MTAPQHRALIVDDSPLNLKLLSTLMMAQGFDVATAVNAEDAHEVMLGSSFDIVLLDLRLPGMNGLTFARQIRGDRTRRQPVIVAVTANAMKTDETAALHAGCDAFVAKPINTRTLVPMLLGLLARSAT